MKDVAGKDGRHRNIRGAKQTRYCGDHQEDRDARPAAHIAKSFDQVADESRLVLHRTHGPGGFYSRPVEANHLQSRETEDKRHGVGKKAASQAEELESDAGKYGTQD